MRTMPESPVADLPLELPAAQEAIPDPPITGEEDDRVMLELAEIALSSALSGLLSSGPQPPVSFVRASAGEAASGRATDGEPVSGRASAGESPAETPASHVEEPPATVEDPAPDLEDVFAQMRAKSAREQQASAALAQDDQATPLIEQGLGQEANPAPRAGAAGP